MAYTKEMTIAQVLKADPETATTLSQFGMHCFGCPGAVGESLEQAAFVHGFSVDELLTALNKSAE